MKPMIARVAMAQAAVTRFKGRPLEYGTTDCVRLAAFVLREAGYNPALSRGGQYSTATGALRALKRTGFASLEAALDDLGLVRIAPAEALPADLFAVPGADGLSALWVALGNGRALGFHEDAPDCCVLAVNYVPETIAWRVHVGEGA